MKAFFFSVFALILLLAGSSQTLLGEPTPASKKEEFLKISYEIEGISDKEALENVKKRLDQDLLEPSLTALNESDWLPEAENSLLGALKPFGYFQAKVKTQLTQNKLKWHLLFSVTLGPPLLLTKIDVRILGPGQNDPVFQRLLADFPLKIGERFQTTAYQAAKQALFLVAYNQGYANALLEKQAVEIDLTRYEATIALYLNTGPLYYFGDIQVKADFFLPEFIQKYSQFSRGELYSAAKVSQFQQNLSNSGYFQQVSVIADVRKAQGQAIPVEVKTLSNKRFAYNLGGGYGTDTGIRGSLGFQWRHITPTGHYFNGNLQASKIGLNLGANYFIPGGDPINDLYNVGVSYVRTVTGVGESNVQSYGGGLTHKAGRWKSIYQLSFLREHFEIKNEEPSSSQLLMPTATFSYIKADSLVRPSQGFSFNLTVRGATQALLSKTDFAQVSLKDAWLIPFSSFNRLLINNSLGATLNKDFDKLPLSIRFSAGSADNLRGYGYQSLGPGEYLFTNSLEFQQRVYHEFFLGLFYDTGNAFNDWKKPDLHAATGASLIWSSPVGNLRLSFARPLYQTKPTWVIQFSMGSFLS